MKSLFAGVVFAVVFLMRAATAQTAGQDIAWVQIEAHPSLRVAQSRAQDYAASLPDVNGFSLGRGWYGIVLGPYVRSDAEQVLRSYRAQRQIPSDSYIVASGTLGQQFWPVGANLLNRGVVAAPQATAPQETPSPLLADPGPVAQPDVAVAPDPADETRAEALRSERALTGDERRQLQVALRAAGFYDSAIDGAFGAGTRRSMQDWQVANGFEATGVLTTMQRQALMEQYNAPLISVGMKQVTDTRAGIEMQMPAGAVRFARYEPPFAHYDPSGELAARVLLISQPGDQATLFGLYDILQTLEIVPLNGERTRQNDRFVIEGRGADLVSHSEARLEGGQIKGFILVWPTGDEDRRARVLTEIQNSFTRLDAVLDPAAGADAQQSIDLVSGLEVRKPRLSRSGFFADRRGAVVTTSEVVQNCTRITLDSAYQAELLTTDEALGVAVLRPTETLAPMAVARLRVAPPRLQTRVSVAGYSYGGVLGGPTLTFGTLADIQGLRGETELSRLELAALPGDAGGPVLDGAGNVLGMLLPRPDSGQKLPRNVSFAADSEAIRNVLDVAGINPEPGPETGFGEGTVPPDDLTRIANGMTVLVSCWD